jgi:flagellar motor switch protein FliG
MDGIKKTALLLSGLEWQTVDLLLGRLDSESAKAVRREMMSLGAVSVKETDRLANEFLHKAGRKHRKLPTIMEHQFAENTNYAPPYRSGERVCFGADAFIPPDHLPNHSSNHSSNYSSSYSSNYPSSSPFNHSFNYPSNRPFDFLRYAETDDIVQEIAEEHPQTVAVVLAHLPASRAGKILGCLPSALQNDVTKRLAEFEETDQQILHEIELSLRERLECRRNSETRRTKGNAVLRKIFETSRTQETNQEPAATEFPNRFYSFHDLEHLNDLELLTLFRSVEPITVLTALIGAKPSLIERVTKHLSPTEEYQMRQQLKHLGTINENDVTRARNILLNKALQRRDDRFID